MASFQPVQLAFKKYEPINEADDNLAPIIFLHGMTDSKEFWMDIPQIVANATKRKAYAIDARNHGDTEWSNDWNFDINADDFIHFMDFHNISKAILVGHSMGGITAIKVALKRPDLVEKIITEDIFVRRPSKEILNSGLMYVSLCRKALEFAPAELSEDKMKKFVMQYVFQNFPEELVQYQGSKDYVDYCHFSHLIALRRDANGNYSFKANLALFEKVLSNPENIMTDAQGLYEGPALFIYGKSSLFSVKSDEHHIKQFFPNAVFEGIEGASHSVHTEKPLEFTDALLKFVCS